MALGPINAHYNDIIVFLHGDKWLCAPYIGEDDTNFFVSWGDMVMKVPAPSGEWLNRRYIGRYQTFNPEVSSIFLKEFDSLQGIADKLRGFLLTGFNIKAGL